MPNPDRHRTHRIPFTTGKRPRACLRPPVPPHPLAPLRALARPAATALVLLLAAAPAARAGTGGADLPWNAPLQTVTDNLTGPTAKTVAALAFVLGGAMWMFTSHEQGAKRFGQALFGVAIVLGAVNLVNALGFQGAIF
jgi:type IV secretion system protein TrbC